MRVCPSISPTANSIEFEGAMADMSVPPSFAVPGLHCEPSLSDLQGSNKLSVGFSSLSVWKLATFVADNSMEQVQ